MDLMRHIKENMIIIPEGQELIRDFVDPIKWMSSDYKMAIPGTKKEKFVKQELVTVQSFLMLNTPVTNELYHSVMNMDYDIQRKDFPVVIVNWLDAIIFCNLLSEKLSLEKCYTLNSVSEKIVFDDTKNGFRLPMDKEWQYACRGNTEGYRYSNIDSIAWFEENSDGRLHEVKIKKRKQFWTF